MQALRRRGVRARALPCIARQALPWPVTLAPAQDGAATIVLCTSPFAARQVIARWPALLAAAAGAPLSCAATAPTTARLLEDAGVPVSIRAAGGVVALARAITDTARGGPRPLVLYPTSDVGDESDEHSQALAMLAPCADVMGGVAYSTTPAAGLDGAVREFERDAALLFFSPSAVTALLAAAARAGVALPAAVVCVGGSTARAFERAAHRAAMLAPRDTDLADFVCSLPEERQ